VASTFDTDGANATIFTGGGSKDDLDTTNWNWKNGSVPDKDDLSYASTSSPVRQRRRRTALDRRPLGLATSSAQP
jgi:hypothetical protein